jgi:hypothetical protein
VRKAKTREELIAAVAEAWNNTKSSDKVELMTKYEELYWSCAWLAAHETVRKERKRWKR